MKAIIPTGGRGTRMQPITFSANKHFIPVANKPLIFYPIEAVVEAGIKEVLITYNPGWLEMVKSYLGNGSRWGLKFKYVLQEEPKGLANIVQVCEEALGGDSFCFHLGDNIFAEGIKEQVNFFQKSKANALVVYVEHKDNTRLGVPRIGKDGKLLEYIEKPKRPPNHFGIPGLYFFDNRVFGCFRGKDKISPSARGELEISDPYNWLVKHGYKVATMKLEGKWMDPGRFNDWIESNQFLLDKNLENRIPKRIPKSVKIVGRVSIGNHSDIKNSQIRGPVSIGHHVTISNSYIGPYTSIDDYCVIENSHVENSVLMQKVNIKDVEQPMDESLIGPESLVSDEDGPTDWLKLFVGEKSVVKV